MNYILRARTFYFVLYTSFILVKMFAFHKIAGLLDNAPLLLAGTIASHLLIYALFAFLPTRGALIAFILADVLMSFILFADTVYNSYFQTIIPKEALFQLGELRGVGESVKGLITWTQFLYFLDLPIWGYLLWLQQRQPNDIHPVPRNLRIKQAVLFVISGLFAWSMINLYMTKEGLDDKQSYISVGVINYHLIDLFQPTPSVAKTSPVEVKKAEHNVKGDLIAYRQTIPTNAVKKLAGVAKGKNVLVIQLESFQNAMINLKINGLEVTPNLNKLIKNSLYFDRFYQENGLGNTADSEFITNNSIFPTTGGPVYKIFPYNHYRTFPMMLKDDGYKTFAFHGYDPKFYDRDLAYPYQGIDKFYSRDNLKNDKIVGMGISDTSMYEQMLPILKENQPFYSLFITLSSHHPFYAPPTGFQFDDSFKESLVGRYLNAIRYTDQSIGELFTLMQQNGLLDNTVIVFYGDHRGVTMDEKETMTKILGKPYTDLTMYTVPLIIHLPNDQGAGTYSIVGGHLDTLPTLANLIGMELPAQAMGRDLVNSKEGFVAYRAYLPEGSFITDNTFFKGSKDYIFEHGQCATFPDAKPLPLENCRPGFDQAKKLFKLTDTMYEDDIIQDMN